MAFLDWFSSDAQPDSWHAIESESDISQMIADSHHQPVAVFKHSSRCGISHSVMSDLVRDSEKAPNNTQMYFLDLLQYRSLSQKVAEDLNVAHQSPQLIILSEGEVVRHASHHAIRWSDMTADIPSGKKEV